MILIIDGNALMNVTVNVIVYSMRNSTNFDLSYIVVNEKMILKDSSKRQFKDFMLKYLTGIVTAFKFSLTELYIVFDNTSWRKYYVEKYFSRHPDIEKFIYKGKRKMDDHKKEVHMFFEYCRAEVIPELIALPGVHEISVKGCEGDDIIAILANDIPGNKAIWSVDSDMNQFIKKGNPYTIVLGPKTKKEGVKRLVVHEKYNEQTNILDFNVDDQNISQVVKHLTCSKEYKVYEVEPNEFLLRKLIAGDVKSDNIPGMYVKVTDSGRHMGITEAKTDKIIAELELAYPKSEWINLVDSKDEQFIDKIVSITQKVLGLSQTNASELRNSFELNRRLIRLSEATIPPEMIEMVRYKYSQLDKSRLFDYQQYLNYVYPET